MLNNLNQPKGSTIGVLRDGRTIQQAFDDLPTISVRTFGAKGDGVADDYPAFQRAALEAQRLGGATIDVPTPAVEYKIGFPVFLFDRTWFRGTGVTCRINFVDPLYARKSRSGFVIGSGYEQGRAKAIKCLEDGTWATTGSVVDSTFTDPPRGTYVRDNPSMVQSRNCMVSDMYLVASYPNGTTLKGGYAVSGANAVDSEVFNIWAEGFTEIINFGSDVPPNTPSCHNCHAHNITSVKPNHLETYYSAGFIANSTHCSITNFKQLEPIAEGSPHGSCASMNYTEFCTFQHFSVPNLGRTATSELILVNNSKGALVDSINGGNAKTCVAEYYTTGSGIFYDRDWPNVFSNIHANKCDNAVALRSKFSTWKGVTQTNCTYHLYFGTTNAQACDVKFVPDTIGFGSGVDGLARIRDNKVAGYRERSTYVRPINFLLEDKATLNSWDTNRNLKAKADAGFRVLYPVPVNMRAIVSVNQYLTFEVGAATKGSKVEVQVRRMASFGGVASEPPIIEFSNAKTATVDTVQDTNVAANAPALVLTATPDMPNSMDILITVSNPSINMNLKEFRVTYLGD